MKYYLLSALIVTAQGATTCSGNDDCGDCQVCISDTVTYDAEPDSPEVTQTCGGLRACGSESTNRVKEFTETWTCTDTNGLAITSENIDTQVAVDMEKCNLDGSIEGPCATDDGCPSNEKCVRYLYTVDGRQGRSCRPESDCGSTQELGEEEGYL